MKRKIFAICILATLVLCLVCTMMLVACNEQQEPEGNPKVEFTFSNGIKIRFELYPDQAPISVANFLRYVDEGFYEGTVIHRVDYHIIPYEGQYYKVPYVVQGGGYTADYLPKQTHDPIKGEFSANGVDNTVSHVMGAISMARTTAMDSATSQFFFCPTDMSDQWDGNYAAFGMALDEESKEAIWNLSLVDIDYETKRPVETIVITSVKRIN